MIADQMPRRSGTPDRSSGCGGELLTDAEEFLVQAHLLHRSTDRGRPARGEGVALGAVLVDHRLAEGDIHAASDHTLLHPVEARPQVGAGVVGTLRSKHGVHVHECGVVPPGGDCAASESELLLAVEVDLLPAADGVDDLRGAFCHRACGVVHVDQFEGGVSQAEPTERSGADDQSVGAGQSEHAE